MRLSRTRHILECAFGIPKSQWIMFHSPVQLNVKRVNYLIKVACVLHNILWTHDCNPANVTQAEQNDQVGTHERHFQFFFIIGEGAVARKFSCLNQLHAPH